MENVIEKDEPRLNEPINKPKKPRGWPKGKPRGPRKLNPEELKPAGIQIL